MKKLYIGYIALLSITSLFFTGIVLNQSSNKNTQAFIVDFISAGRYEVVYVNKAISEVITSIGLHQVYISRNINEPWNISFSVTSFETSNVPIYISIKTLDGTKLYNTVVSAREGYLFLDCKFICDKLSQ